MLKRLRSLVEITDPDAVAREVVEDAQLLADEKHEPTTFTRDGVTVEIGYDSASTSIKSLRRSPEVK